MNVERLTNPVWLAIMFKCPKRGANADVLELVDWPA